MKYLVVTRESERSFLKSPQRQVVFIVHPEEEMKIRAALRESPQKMDIVMSKHLTDAAAYDELASLLTLRRTLAVSTQLETTPELTTMLLQAHIRGVRVTDYESALMELVPSVPSNHAELVKFLAKGRIHQNRTVRTYKTLKNVVEPLVAAALLLILSPLLIAVAIAIKLTSPGPVLYGQKRLGLDGKEFEIYKFRSMRTDAEKNGPVWAAAKTNDARLSPIGAFLRGTHIDELPQFINILKGEVSFIGPRPERRVFSDQLVKDIPMFPVRTMVKPGISGWAQTRQGYANSVEDSRKKLELDLYYILKHSARLDALIVLNTLGVISTGGTEGKKREITAALGAKDASAAEINTAAVEAAMAESVGEKPRRNANAVGLPFRVPALTMAFRVRAVKRARQKAAQSRALRRSTTSSSESVAKSL